MVRTYLIHACNKVTQCKDLDRGGVNVPIKNKLEQKLNSKCSTTAPKRSTTALQHRLTKIAALPRLRRER